MQNPAGTTDGGSFGSSKAQHETVKEANVRKSFLTFYYIPIIIRIIINRFVKEGA